MIKDIPNMLTMLRIVLIPVLVASFYLDNLTGRYLAAMIFIFASVTDYFDGMLARRLDAYSNFGRMLDPIADKMLVVSTLLMIVHKDLVSVFTVIIILCREIFVSGLREYLAEFKVSLPVNGLAKVKTAVQMIAISIVLLGEEVVKIQYTSQIGKTAIWLSAVLTLITGYAYLKEVFKHI